jgi:hypothetical protein
MAERPRRHEVVADALLALGGAALFGSAFVRWVARGTGSSLRGHALIDALVALGRHDAALSSGRLSVLWYLVPALGAASCVAGGVAGVRHVSTRVLAGAALAAAVIVFAAFVRLVGYDRLAWGPKLALAGALAVVAAAWLPRPEVLPPRLSQAQGRSTR